MELEGWVGSKSQFKEAQWGQNETVLEKLAEELVNLCSGLVLEEKYVSFTYRSSSREAENLGGRMIVTKMALSSLPPTHTPLLRKREEPQH